MRALRWCELVVVVVMASSCHHGNPSTLPSNPEPQQIAPRGGAAEASLSIFITVYARIYERVKVVFEPAVGARISFPTSTGEVEWICDRKNSITIYRGLSCFVRASCDDAISSWLHVDWGYTGLAEFMAGGIPLSNAADRRHEVRMIPHGLAGTEWRDGKRAWEIRHRVDPAVERKRRRKKTPTAEDEHSARRAAFQLSRPSQSTVEFGDGQFPGIAVAWGEWTHAHMDPAQVDLTPPDGFVPCSLAPAPPLAPQPPPASQPPRPR
jgi:hypothetical protein